ncbi:MAG: hypothetical protein JNL11_08380 [Bdellovibrionaceae bacterium]|nr:hypothetical protein [Pseudobdellovibrionaceae bacterium]
MKIHLVWGFFLFLSQGASAEILLSANYFKYSRQDHPSLGEAVQSEISSYDINVQLLLSSRFVLGATQMTETTSQLVQGRRETLAPNIGFFLGPVLIEGGPVSKSYERGNLSLPQEWRDGRGYYAALTVYDRWASWLLIGFQFTFLNIEYNKYFDGSVELVSQTKTVSVLNPAFRLSLVF